MNIYDDIAMMIIVQPAIIILAIFYLILDFFNAILLEIVPKRNHRMVLQDSNYSIMYSKATCLHKYRLVSL